jgi:hypothetical protein
MPETDAMKWTPTCRICGDVIGVYEPAVRVRKGRARSTSRAAASPGELIPEDELYHRDCYVDAHGRGGP